MTRTEAETLAVLSERVTQMARQLDQNTRDTASIKSSLDNLSGGKQALMWLIGFMVSVGVIVSTYLGFHK